MTNGFASYHDKNLQIYFFCVKRSAKNDFLEDVESTVGFQGQVSVHWSMPVLLSKLSSYYTRV